MISPCPEIERPPRRTPIVDRRWLTAAAIAAALLFAGVLTSTQIEAVWRRGAFLDSDDAMRAVQLRDFLAGQGWFDLLAHRLDPPIGQSMHWSRVVDVALAGLDRVFMLFMLPENAERAMRLVFPAVLLVLLLFLCDRLGSLLAGVDAGFASIFLVILSGPMFLQFTPGRIDHHAPQIVVLVAALLSLLRGLDPRRAGTLAIVAALMSLSLSISLENLPFFLPMAVALLALFIVDGVAARGQLSNFAMSALVMAPALYIATVPDAMRLPSACDAFSFVHVAVFIIGALSLLALASLSPRLTTTRARALAALLAVLASAASVLLIAPKCAGDPLGGIDPLIRELWLSHVREASPLHRTAMIAPVIAIAIATPVATGFLAALFFSSAGTGLSRRRWLLVAATVAVGIAGGFWQVRVFSSITPIAMAPLAAFVLRGVAHLKATPALRATLAAALLFFLSPMGLVSLLASETTAGDLGEAACLTPEASGLLAKLPPDRVISSFSLGPFILAQTPHSVFAAPYHRNNHGNRVAADIFLAAPDEAEALARAAGVGLVVWCAPHDGAPVSSLVEAAPAGLAARLDQGETPPWLEKKSRDGDPLLVFAVRPME